MRQVADGLGLYPAAVGQVEKGYRVVKEDKIPIWAEALGVDGMQLYAMWAQIESENPAPPIERTRTKSIERGKLVELIETVLTGNERERLLGYAEALIEQRNA